MTSSFATYPFNVFRCGVQVSAKRFPMSFGAQCRDASTPSSCRSCALRKLSHRDTQDLDFLHRIEPRGAETAQFTPKIHNFFLFHLGSLYRNHSYMLLVRFSPTLIQLGIQIGYQIYYSDDYTGFVRLLFGIKSGHWDFTSLITSWDRTVNDLFFEFVLLMFDFKILRYQRHKKYISDDFFFENVFLCYELIWGSNHLKNLSLKLWKVVGFTWDWDLAFLLVFYYVFFTSSNYQA